MDNQLFMSVLFDYYGQLLTKRQRDIFDMYVNRNLSLGEISEIIGISRQGVHDSLVKSEKSLADFENKLNICKKNEKLSTLLDSIKEIVEKAQISEEKKEETKEIINLINELI